MNRTAHWLALSLGVACTWPKPDEDPPPVFAVLVPPAASCAAAGPACLGLTRSGPSAPDDSSATRVSCCETIGVTGGTFPMGIGRVSELSDELLEPEAAEHIARVSDFYLDRFEITRGRFRAFAEAYASAGPPEDGSGAHPRIPKSGWQDTWNIQLPPDPGALLDHRDCRAPMAELGDADTAAGAAEDEPMGCLSWFVAFAFCIWDGGRLPTEAEWEYAAAGGVRNQTYPWGSDPSLVPELEAAWGPVGAHPDASGAFGHQDLAGGVREWVLDYANERYYLNQGRSCRDCANLSEANGRALRGGRDSSCCSGNDSLFWAAARGYAPPGSMQPGSRDRYRAPFGARCARDVERSR